MEQVDVAVIGGGQSGLAAAHALRGRGRRPVLLEASGRAGGSWPHYYDSLTLFSPARFCSLPGMPFPGDPDRYPHRDEVAEYLAAYAARLDAEVRTGSRVAGVREDGPGFVLELADGARLAARAVVAATGTFGRPYRPALPGLGGFTGAVVHSSEYRNPAPYEGRRVVVVGAGNSAVQIAAELAEVAHATLATRRPVRFAPQRPLGRDLHVWLTRSGIDRAPVGRLLRTPPSQPVIDDGRYRGALLRGAPDRRPPFAGAEGREITWADGTTEAVDAIVLATGYRPDLSCLTGRLAPGGTGRPSHRGGVSTAHPGLAFVGLDWQRSLSSNALRGVGRDAAHIARRLAAHLAAR
ncbi:NAD(P)/FAD-dependent oxidoreductase [Streptomyces sp. MUM 203J]|uniref:flavin-containing monooxygenase n=1 Tax=Streptomyces sp. MUM 203J TaxID=2791990 RepID=UPI001F04EC79|nr:NAD(P)-binding domain-containing protein [Streptomyces sp. MUM 203J]MCH0543326.1 NAD(P)/FAD-dependent oxidoreductase [Streptomyces sp. MUM 203J]